VKKMRSKVSLLYRFSCHTTTIVQKRKATNKPEVVDVDTETGIAL